MPQVPLNTHSRFLGSLAVSVTTAALLLPAVVAAQALAKDANPTPMEKERESRSPDVHWPEGFDPATAAVFAHDELPINATCERVWNHLIEARAWPTWSANVQKVKLMHTYATSLKQGSVFLWQTSGQVRKNKVNESVAPSRIGWYGFAPDAMPTSYRTFYLTPNDGGCRVVTEEAGNVPAAASLNATGASPRHREHDPWLASLKTVSEN